ncbi:MAG: hypothetical protein K2G67_04840 [Muribaculaceae bacterium]|nr:hypothetical protein [Muribaculaceae bacterium]
MKLIESKLVAWFALLLVIALVVMAMLLGTPWWGFIAIFFCFLGIFAHLASLYLRKMSKVASAKLEQCALVLIILSIIGFIAEYIIYNFAM